MKKEVIYMNKIIKTNIFFEDDIAYINFNFDVPIKINIMSDDQENLRKVFQNILELFINDMNIEFEFNKEKDDLYSETAEKYISHINNELKISYEGVSDKDTILNLTNHSYFNLSGHKSRDATNQKLWINSKYFTPVKDSNCIPTGEITPVKETPMDFTIPKKINSQINEDYDQLRFCGGYDHNFVIDKKEKGVEKIATLYDENTNITMEVYSDREGVQFYAGNFISGGPIGKENTIYEDRCGICLETQYFPDSINNKNFRSPILKEGETYESTTVYKFLW